MKPMNDDDEIPELRPLETSSTLVPVTIISGFLGAGKTTLLHYILTSDHGKRIAVIENEFGQEIGIEKLIAKDGINGNVLEDFYELSNGCICCSVRDDLLNTLERLLEKRDRFDYILIETTGMANPGKVASLFWVDAELEGRIYLDGIVTLVDTPRIEFLLDHQETQMEAASQIAYADRILLNKQDLLEPNKRKRIKTRVQSINQIAHCQWTERSQIDLNHILNIQSFTTQRAQTVEAALNLNDSKPLHTGGIQTTCITIPNESLYLDKLERWLGELLWEQSERAEGTTTYFRIKGVVAIQEDREHKYIVQAVHELFEVYATQEIWQENDIKSSRIVFIGLHLDPNALETGLRQCLT